MLLVHTGELSSQEIRRAAEEEEQSFDQRQPLAET